MKFSDWEISTATFYAIVLILTIVLWPIPGGLQFILPFLAIPIYLKLKKNGRIKDWRSSEIFLILFYTIAIFTIALFFGILTLSNTPWWKIILVGMSSDIIATLLGRSRLGDFGSAIVNIAVALIVIGGVPGAIIAMIVGLISIFKGGTFGAITITLIVLKIISGVIV